MAGILRQDGKVFVFGWGKFKGQTLAEVAAEQPSYLQWVHSEASDRLDKSALRALEDAMEDYDIDY